MEYVFISYSTVDKEIANAICHVLEDNGIPCWIAPRDIMPGVPWASAVMKGIRDCKVMLLVYSINSNSSQQVANEVDRAFSNNKPIIPFLSDSTPMNDEFDYYLSRKHWLIAYPNYREKLGPLVDIVKGFFGDTIHASKAESKNEQEAEHKKVPETESYVETKIEKKEETRVQEKKQLKLDVNKESKVEERDEQKHKAVTSIPKQKKNASKPEVNDNDVPKSNLSFETEVVNGFEVRWDFGVTDAQKDAVRCLLNDMVKVEGGTLMLGASPEQKKADNEEKPAHQVTMSTYHIGRCPVIKFDWDRIMGLEKDLCFAHMPITNISLLDCERFVENLRRISGINFEIPTEAEWEFAARGGIKSKGYIYSGSNDLSEVGWRDSFLSGTNGLHEPGEKKSNELGLKDMSGNVWEWCCEKKGRYSLAPSTDPYNFYKPPFGYTSLYVCRGGSHLSDKTCCRVSYRRFVPWGTRDKDLGLRLVVRNERRIYDIGDSSGVLEKVD